MGIVERRPQVSVDLIEYAEYLSTNSLDVALRFLDAAEATFTFIAKSPEIGTLCKFQSHQVEKVRF